MKKDIFDKAQGIRSRIVALKRNLNFLSDEPDCYENFRGQCELKYWGKQDIIIDLKDSEMIQFFGILRIKYTRELKELEKEFEEL